MKIVSADIQDLQQILELQFLAYQSEAKLVNNYSIQPLTQTLGELEKEYLCGTLLKAIDGEGNIIGSVRGRSENDTCYIGKLIVHPSLQGRGIGTCLLNEIEKACPQSRYELFTSDKSTRTIKLYESLGYRRYKEMDIADGIKLVYLHKQLAKA